MKILKHVLTKNGNSPVALETGVNGLIKDLSQLQRAIKEDQVVIFRGQPNSNFKLTPGAFRADKIAEVKLAFPVSSYDIWCHDEKFRENVKGWAKNSFEQLVLQEPFRRLLEVTFYIMQFNYSFGQFYLANQEKFDSHSHQLNKLRPAPSWIEEKTFHQFFGRNLQNVLTFISLDGKILKHATFEENFTGLDESFPQHYGLPTTGLDWTYNPFISLYFAIDRIPKNATHFAVYACKLLHSKNQNPLILKYGHPEIENPRIKNQEGVFISIQSACLFYFNHGMWPSIEDYLLASQGNFELVKYEIPISYQEECCKLLNEIGITHAFLFPDAITDELKSSL